MSVVQLCHCHYLVQRTGKSYARERNSGWLVECTKQSRVNRSHCTKGNRLFQNLKQAKWYTVIF